MNTDSNLLNTSLLHKMIPISMFICRILVLYSKQTNSYFEYDYV